MEEKFDVIQQHLEIDLPLLWLLSGDLCKPDLTACRVERFLPHLVRSEPGLRSDLDIGILRKIAETIGIRAAYLRY